MFSPKFLLLSLVVLFAIILLPALFKPKKFRKELRRLISRKDFVKTMGGFELLIAFFFLSTHWKLSGGWMMTISIIGWLTLIDGIVLIWFTDYIKKPTKKMIKSDKNISILAFLGVLITVFLAYIAFNLL